jgi:LytS/YehU family sensor histidine kinase
MDKERITELKNLTYSMELNELKNQVSPHFLFNMLNNVKALIRTNPEMASMVIMKLSEFLRYQLYENNGEKTLLASEIDFLLNFLNLEKIRKDNLQIIFETPIKQTLQNTTFIPLGLFTVFVENAIKYSVNTNEEETYIKIDLKVENNMLYFNCINSKSIDIPVFDDKKGGLGLVNIKRRLELLYNNQHKLNITSSANEYIVNLIIPL